MSTILNIKKSPYQLLLLTAIALLFVLVFSPIAKMDFQDVKMFSVPLVTMLWIIPVLLIVLWLLYVFTNRFLYSVTITQIHVFITVFATVSILIVLYVGINPSQRVTNNHDLIGKSMQLTSIIFVSAQLLYLANVLLGLFTIKKFWIKS
jgi:hypothetical protein